MKQGPAAVSGLIGLQCPVQCLDRVIQRRFRGKLVFAPDVMSSEAYKLRYDDDVEVEKSLQYITHRFEPFDLI